MKRKQGKRSGARVRKRPVSGDVAGARLIDALCSNAERLRLAGERELAGAALAQAEKRLSGSRSPRLEAHYWLIRGRLLRDQGERTRAREAFARAAALARESGWVEGAGTALVEKGGVELSAGDGRAASDSFAALASLEWQKLSARTSLLAAHGRALALVLSGEEKAGLEALEAARRRHPAAADTPEYLELLLVEGRLRSEAEPDRAEQLLARACSGFSRQGLDLGAARACLSVAVLLTEAGRNRQLGALCAEMAPLFRSRRLPLGARDALETFREAVEAGGLTVQLAKAVGGFLDQVQLEARLQFFRPMIASKVPSEREGRTAWTG